VESINADLKMSFRQNSEPYGIDKLPKDAL